MSMLYTALYAMKLLLLTTGLPGLRSCTKAWHAIGVPYIVALLRLHTIDSACSTALGRLLHHRRSPLLKAVCTLNLWFQKLFDAHSLLKRSCPADYQASAIACRRCTYCWQAAEGGEYCTAANLSASSESLSG